MTEIRYPIRWISIQHSLGRHNLLRRPDRCRAHPIFHHELFKDIDADYIDVMISRSRLTGISTPIPSSDWKGSEPTYWKLHSDLLLEIKRILINRFNAHLSMNPLDIDKITREFFKNGDLVFFDFLKIDAMFIINMNNHSSNPFDTFNIQDLKSIGGKLQIPSDYLYPDFPKRYWVNMCQPNWMGINSFDRIHLDEHTIEQLKSNIRHGNFPLNGRTITYSWFYRESSSCNINNPLLGIFYLIYDHHMRNVDKVVRMIEMLARPSNKLNIYGSGYKSSLCIKEDDRVIYLLDP
jgi:hypothetical protein